MRQTVKNRMIKNVQMMAVGMMATASIMGTAAAMGVKMDNIPFNVLANPFQAVMTQGVAAIELGSSGCQHFHERQHDCYKVNAHRQSNAGLDSFDRRIGKPLQIRDF